MPGRSKPLVEVKVSEEELEVLTEIKDRIRDLVWEGEAVECPACERRNEVGSYSISNSMSRALIAFYAEYRREWGYWPYVRDLLANRKGNKYLVGYVPSGTNFASLRQWGITEDYSSGKYVSNGGDGRREDGGHIGRYRVTDLGEEFVFGRVKIPKFGLSYHNLWYFPEDGPQVDIGETLPNSFDLREVLDAIPY